MRRRIVWATVTVAVTGILVLGLPLAFLARRGVRDDAVRRLDREATSVAFAIDDDLEHDRSLDQALLDQLAGSDRQITVRETNGRVVTGGAAIVGSRIVGSATVEQARTRDRERRGRANRPARSPRGDGCRRPRRNRYCSCVRIGARRRPPARWPGARTRAHRNALVPATFPCARRAAALPSSTPSRRLSINRRHASMTSSEPSARWRRTPRTSSGRR